MAQNKPGVHTSQGFAIHSPVLGKWVNAITWAAYDRPKNTSLLRRFTVVDLPVQIASIETTARLIRDALPRCIEEELREVGKQLDNTRTLVNRAVTNNWDAHYIWHNMNNIQQLENDDQQLRTLLNGPLDIVEITRETNIVHRVLP